MGAPGCPLQSPAQQALPASPWPAALPGQTTAPLSRLPATLPVTTGSRREQRKSPAHTATPICVLRLWFCTQEANRHQRAGAQPTARSQLHGPSWEVTSSLCICLPVWHRTGEGPHGPGGRHGGKGHRPTPSRLPWHPRVWTGGRRGGEGGSRWGACRGHAVSATERGHQFKLCEPHACQLGWGGILSSGVAAPQKEKGRERSLEASELCHMGGSWAASGRPGTCGTGWSHTLTPL